MSTRHFLICCCVTAVLMFSAYISRYTHALRQVDACVTDVNETRRSYLDAVSVHFDHSVESSINKKADALILECYVSVSNSLY